MKLLTEHPSSGVRHDKPTVNIRTYQNPDNRTYGVEIFYYTPARHSVYLEMDASEALFLASKLTSQVATGIIE